MAARPALSPAESAILDAGVAAMPECYSDPFHRCLNYDNVGGIPAEQCDAIIRAYDINDAAWDYMDEIAETLTMCKPQTGLFVAGAFAAGVGVTMLVMLFSKRRGSA